MGKGGKRKLYFRIGTLYTEEVLYFRSKKIVIVQILVGKIYKHTKMKIYLVPNCVCVCYGRKFPVNICPLCARP